VKKVKIENAVLQELVGNQRADLDELTAIGKGLVKAIAATDSSLALANGHWKAVYKAHQALGGALLTSGPSPLEKRLTTVEAVLEAGKVPGLGCAGQCGFTPE
jgi:hypothetical protein